MLEDPAVGAVLDPTGLDFMPAQLLSEAVCSMWLPPPLPTWSRIWAQPQDLDPSQHLYQAGRVEGEA